jgi:hypothetical protein
VSDGIGNVAVRPDQVHGVSPQADPLAWFGPGKLVELETIAPAHASERRARTAIDVYLDQAGDQGR